jgi:hypothetical protein
VGKGRQIAGIIMDNYARGRRQAVWLSTSAVRPGAPAEAAGVVCRHRDRMKQPASAVTQCSADARRCQTWGGVGTVVSYGLFENLMYVPGPNR